MGIIVFILILALLVLVHEFGHFLMAKKNGVLVEEFGIGFPPRLFSIKRGETLYSINALPIGGFVKLYGEEYQETRLKERAFVYKKPWQKALIVIAGVIGNFLLGWILISYLFTQGVPTPANKVIVEQVQADSPAVAAGIKVNDSILRLIPLSPQISPIPVTSSNDLINFTKKYAGQKIQLVIERGGKQQTLTIVPRKNPPSGQGPLGIAITSFIEKKYTWYQAPFYGLVEAVAITKTIVVEITKVLAGLVTLHKPGVEVTGPIGIANYTGQAIKFGKNAVLELIALLSLNLAIVNILPFPALDGGRFVFIIYEWVTKKRVNQNVERYTNLVGFMILIALTVVITINDIARLLR